MEVLGYSKGSKRESWESVWVLREIKGESWNGNEKKGLESERKKDLKSYRKLRMEDEKEINDKIKNVRKRKFESYNRIQKERKENKLKKVNNRNKRVRMLRRKKNRDRKYMAGLEMLKQKELEAYVRYGRTKEE